MQDQVVIITGGTSGMGKGAAAQLAQKGAIVALIGRNREKGEAAAVEIRQGSGSEAVTFLQANLSLMREVQQVAWQVSDMYGRVDALVHGAGGSFPKQRTVTDEGVEFNFAVQYLARFVLTDQLADLLHAAPNPRVLSIAGGAWGTKKLGFDDLQSEKSYGKFEMISKCAALNYLLTLEQMDRYPGIQFYNHNPGLTRTATVTGGSMFASLFFNTVGRLFSRPPGPAADEIAALLTGEYPAGFYEASLKPQDYPVAESDRELGKELRHYSHDLVAKLLPEDETIDADRGLVLA